jgi:hypothetical protein
MAYSKAKLKSRNDKAYPYFRPFWIGNLSDKCRILFVRLLSSAAKVEKHNLDCCAQLALSVLKISVRVNMQYVYECIAV